METLKKEMMEAAMQAMMETMQEKQENDTPLLTQEDAKETAQKRLEKEKTVEEKGIIAGNDIAEEENVIGGGIMAEPMPMPEQEEEREEDYIIRFAKPYRFEGKTYAGIDLSGLLQMKAKDIWRMNRSCRSVGLASVIPELDAEYTARVAACASHLPIEFFEELPLPEMTKIKMKVSNFFM